MGNSDRKAAVKDTQLVSVTTSALKDRLNKLYDSRKNASNMVASQSAVISQEGRFEYLWDLKELALMEGRSEVEVPANWLDELEDTCEPRRTH